MYSRMTDYSKENRASCCFVGFGGHWGIEPGLAFVIFSVK